MAQSRGNLPYIVCTNPLLLVLVFLSRMSNSSYVYRLIQRTPVACITCTTWLDLHRIFRFSRMYCTALCRFAPCLSNSTVCILCIACIELHRVFSQEVLARRPYAVRVGNEWNKGVLKRASCSVCSNERRLAFDKLTWSLIKTSRTKKIYSYNCSSNFSSIKIQGLGMPA